MSVCGFCGGALGKKQRLFCSKGCYRKWQHVGSNACRVGRLAYTKGEPTTKKVNLGDLVNKANEEYYKQLNQIKSKHTVIFNDRVNYETHKNSTEIIKSLKQFRQTNFNTIK